MDQRDIDTVNRLLVDHFGRLENTASWRVVWSEDQFEYRYGTYEDRTPEGFFIREVTERRKVPKYSQWVNSKWVLERILVVPLSPNPDHPELSTGLSYEPIWVFEDDLPPTWGAVQFVVKQVYENMRQANTGVKYKDPDSEPKEAEHLKEERIKELEESLFSDETDTGDALAYRQGVGFTTSKVKE